MRARSIDSRQRGCVCSTRELKRHRAAVVESPPLRSQGIKPRPDGGDGLGGSDWAQGAGVGCRRSGQRANRGLGLHQSPQVDLRMLDERLSVAHERGLIVDEPDLDPAVDQAPEPVRQPEFLLDHQMA